MHCTALYSTLHGAALHAALHCTARCAALYAALRWTALNFTELNWIKLYLRIIIWARHIGISYTIHCNPTKLFYLCLFLYITYSTLSDPNYLKFGHEIVPYIGETTLEWSPNSFWGTTNMSGFLENCQKYIFMYDSSPIQGTISVFFLRYETDTSPFFYILLPYSLHWIEPEFYIYLSQFSRRPEILFISGKLLEL